MSSKLALAAITLLGAAAVVAAAPVAGLVIGASVAANALLGGAAGFAVGALALPLPVAYLLSGASSAEPEDANKSRLFRMGKEFVNIYKIVGGALLSLLPSKPVKNEVRTDDDDWHVEDFGPYAGFGNGKVTRDFADSAPRGTAADAAPKSQATKAGLKPG